MAVTARWYAEGAKHFALGDFDWDPSGGSALKISLHTSGYTADLDEDEFWDTSATNEAPATGGYTTGGEALVLLVAVNQVDTDLAMTWTAATTYAVGDLVKAVSPSGFIYRCIVAGETHAVTEPTWINTIGRDTAIDNEVYWETVGTSFTKLDAVDTSWTPNTTIASITQAVIYKVGAAGSADFLLGHIAFGTTESSSNGDFDITYDANGVLQMFISL